MPVFNLKAALLGGGYHPHFPDEEVTELDMAPGHTSSNWQSQNDGSLPCVFKVLWTASAFLNLTSQYFLSDKDDVRTVFVLPSTSTCFCPSQTALLASLPLLSSLSQLP